MVAKSIQLKDRIGSRENMNRDFAVIKVINLFK